MVQAERPGVADADRECGSTGASVPLASVPRGLGYCSPGGFAVGAAAAGRLPVRLVG